MNIFDNIIEKDGKIISNGWIEWSHHDYINYDTMPKQLAETLKTLHEKLMLMLGHCERCIALNACHFMESNMPKNPVDNSDGLLHPNCHCKTLPIATPIQNKTAFFAICPIEKFTGYVFSNNYIENGKKELFDIFGFNISDSEYLQKEYEKQALNKYVSGEYKPGVLNRYGQKIAIAINLKGRHFKTACMVKPKGKIQIITPFGGWLKNEI